MNDKDQKKNTISPRNFREITFQFSKKEVVVAGMAKPNFRGAITSDTMQFLNSHGYDVLISLNPEAEYKSNSLENDIIYKPIPIKDFTAPTKNTFEN